MITVPGQAKDYQPKQSGSMRPGAARQENATRGEIRSAARMPITVLIPGIQAKSNLTRQTDTGYTIWPGMFGNGLPIGLMKAIILSALLTIRLVPQAECVALRAAGPGTTVRSAYARPIAVTSAMPTATVTISVVAASRSNGAGCTLSSGFPISARESEEN